MMAGNEGNISVIVLPVWLHLEISGMVIGLASLVGLYFKLAEIGSHCHIYDAGIVYCF